jgi:hypothetical protein
LCDSTSDPDKIPPADCILWIAHIIAIQFSVRMGS